MSSNKMQIATVRLGIAILVTTLITIGIIFILQPLAYKTPELFPRPSQCAKGMDYASLLENSLEKSNVGYGDSKRLNGIITSLSINWLGGPETSTTYESDSYAYTLSRGIPKSKLSTLLTQVGRILIDQGYSINKSNTYETNDEIDALYFGYEKADTKILITATLRGSNNAYEIVLSCYSPR